MSSRTHRLTLHDLELEVTYDYEPAYPGRGPTMSDSGGEPAYGASATVTAVHVVDPVVQQLRSELGRVLRSANPNPFEHPAMHPAWASAKKVMDDTRTHVGPELSDDWFDRGETYRDLLREVVYGDIALPGSLRSRIATALALFNDPRSQIEAQLVEHEADADADARDQHDEDVYAAARDGQLTRERLAETLSNVQVAVTEMLGEVRR